MRALVFICLLLTAAWCSADGADESRSSARLVVVPSHHVAGAYSFAEWHASAADLAKLQTALEVELKKNGLDVSVYYLRVTCVLKEGVKHIMGYGADSRSEGAEEFLRPASTDPHEETIPLFPSGGGEAYFRFDFDVASNKIEFLTYGAAL